MTNTFSAWDPTGALDPRAPNNNELEWRTVVQVTAINNAIEYCNPAADSCNVSSSWPRASYTYTGVGSAQPGMPLIFTVTTGAQDPTVARTTTYYLPETYPIPYAWFENKPTTRVVPPSSITFPGSSAPDISISYDQRGRVATVTYHGNGSTRTWSYSYSDSANPYITNQAVSRRVAPPPSQPVPSPPAPAAGYAGTIQRTTTVTNPLNQSTVYTSSVDFRSQCGIASYEYVTEWLWDLYEAYFCNTQFLDARLLSTKDPLNRTTSYQYDSFRRLTRVTGSGSHSLDSAAADVRWNLRANVMLPKAETESQHRTRSA